MEYFNLTSQVFKQANFLDLDRIKILMIDDNRKDINFIQDLLEVESNIKFSLYGCTTPQEAIRLLESKIIEPNLIILDCVMPSTNGKMLLEKLKASPDTASIPVVIHSSLSNYENIAYFKKLKAHAFFEKPMDISAFEGFLLEN